MATSTNAQLTGANLRELIALNEEIAALVRVGVPLERGLAALGRDLPGRLGQATSDLSQRLERGETLVEAFEQQQPPAPAVYRAVVAAGLRSGQLAAALESMSATARRLADLRRTTGFGLLYPTLVVLLAWGLFCFFALQLSVGYEAFEMAHNVALDAIGRWRDAWWFWAPWPPLLLVLGVWAWWRRAGRATSLEHNRGALSWVPSARKLTEVGRAATMAELFALLVERGVPLAETMRLASDASGDRRMRAAGLEIAAALEQGQSLAEAARERSELPPLLRWHLLSCSSQERLAEGMRHAAQTYRRRAEQIALWSQLFVPLVLTVGLGASVTLAYALLVFWPWIQVMHRLLQV